MTIRVINLYYTLLYLFSWITLCGLLLCFCNNELAAGFLWATEVLVIFIFLLMLFYINNLGDTYKIKVESFYIYTVLIIFFIILLPNTQKYSENVQVGFFDDLCWIDYYESLFYTLMNDFLGFFLSYYRLNSFILIVVGYILYIGSLVCIILFSSFKKFKFNNVDSLFEILSLSQAFIYCLFFRKQDLFEQNLFFAALNKISQKYD